MHVCVMRTELAICFHVYSLCDPELFPPSVSHIISYIL